VSVAASRYLAGGGGVPEAPSRNCSLLLTRFFPAGDDGDGRSTSDEIKLSRSSVRLTLEGVGAASWIVSQLLAITNIGFCLPLQHLDSGDGL
jgi:hypothetical protein